MNTITIQDNFINKKLYEELTSLHIEYNKVHWIGALAKPKNALHKLVKKRLWVGPARLVYGFSPSRNWLGSWLPEFGD